MKCVGAVVLFATCAAVFPAWTATQAFALEGLTLPNGCRDVPAEGIDSHPGQIKCTMPAVTIDYDVFGMPGVPMSRGESLRARGPWPKGSWVKRVKVDGVPAEYGVGRCPVAC